MLFWLILGIWAKTFVLPCFWNLTLKVEFSLFFNFRDLLFIINIFLHRCYMMCHNVLRIPGINLRTFLAWSIHILYWRVFVGVQPAGIVLCFDTAVGDVVPTPLWERKSFMWERKRFTPCFTFFCIVITCCATTNCAGRKAYRGLVKILLHATLNGTPRKIQTSSIRNITIAITVVAACRSIAQAVATNTAKSSTCFPGGTGFC